MTPFVNAHDHEAALRATDPNNIKSWVTCLSGGSMKFHTSRRTALNFVTRYNYVTLWEWNLQKLRWDLVTVKCADAHQQVCDRCGGTTTLKPLNSHYGWYRPTLTWPDGTEDWGVFEWVRDKKGKIIDPPKLEYLCARCRNV